MNGIAEAHCEVLEEPVSLTRPAENEPEADPYQPIPARVILF